MDESQRIALRRREFEAQQVDIFPEILDRLHGLCEDILDDAIRSNDGTILKATLSSLHQATARVVGRIEAVAIARGTPIGVVEKMTRRAIEGGRENPILTESEDSG